MLQSHPPPRRARSPLASLASLFILASAGVYEAARNQ